MVEQSLEGGCLCGRVRYQIDRYTGPVSHCHCRHCQRSSAAAFVTWVELNAEDFSWTGVTPAEDRRPSDTTSEAIRTFCVACGSSLTYARIGKDWLAVTVSSLDDPEAVKPEMHVYACRELSWAKLHDGLPRHDQLPPAHSAADPTAVRSCS